jgi:thiamine-phosphate pyrophosphorylase
MPPKMKPSRIERFQFVTADRDDIPHHIQAETVCAAGGRWIQYRTKNQNPVERRNQALMTLHVCRKYNAVIIVNDYPELAKEIDADGVHLGRNDMHIARARDLLGNNMLIGGSSNSLEDILRNHNNGADYTGLGPFRFTHTKKDLNPVLGMETCRKILHFLKEKDIDIPVIAIGGIVPEVVTALLMAGAFGIAVSSAVIEAEDPVKTMNTFLKLTEQFKYGRSVDHSRTNP